MTAAEGPLSALRESIEAVRAHSAVRPEWAIILGTGLARLAEEIESSVRVPYAEIPHLRAVTVESHTGNLVLGRLAGCPVVAMEGRFHRYEGHSLQDVTYPVRLMGMLGAQALIVSNACGSMNPLWEPGDIMLIDDHINLLGDNPLVGPNVDALGPRFPDMSEPYDPELQETAQAVALSLRIPLRRGVYAAVMGPNLETRAEYRMLRTLGADVVGMSTVPEVIVARHMGMRVLGLSIITDRCLPDALEPADIAEILRIAAEAEPKLSSLVRGVLRRRGCGEGEMGEMEGTEAAERGGRKRSMKRASR